jgi:hypothetical protein
VGLSCSLEEDFIQRGRLQVLPQSFTRLQVCLVSLPKEGSEAPSYNTCNGAIGLYASQNFCFVLVLAWTMMLFLMDCILQTVLRLVETDHEGKTIHCRPSSNTTHCSYAILLTTVLPTPLSQILYPNSLSFSVFTNLVFRLT